MKQKLSVLTLALALILVMALFSRDTRPAPTAAAAATAVPLDPQTRAQIVTKARHEYYNARDRGLEGFQCDVFVDWEAVKRGWTEQSVSQEQLAANLKTVKFHVVVAPTGASSVSHQSYTTPSDQELAKRMQMMIGYAEGEIPNLLQMWSQFAINSPFREPTGGYTLEEVENHYRLTMKYKGLTSDGASDVMVLNHDLTMDHLEVVATEGKAGHGAVFKFSQAPDGFMLADVDGNITSARGKTYHTALKYTYQQVSGFELPRVVTSILYLPDGKVTPYTFANCQVTAADKVETARVRGNDAKKAQTER